MRSESLEELQSSHAGWDRGSRGVEVRAVVLLSGCSERYTSCVRVECHRVLCRHRDCAAVIIATALLYEDQEPCSTVLLVLDAHEEVVPASSRADQKGGGDMLSQLLLLGALER